ncbi:unnamed protein product, partial [Rotaria magnacalcarata]
INSSRLSNSFSTSSLSLSAISSSVIKYDLKPGITNSPKADKLFDALSVISRTTLFPIENVVET